MDEQEFHARIKAGKMTDAILLICVKTPQLGLGEAKTVVESFAAEWK